MLRRQAPLALALALASPIMLTACERGTQAPSETDEADRLTEQLLAQLRLGEHDAALGLCAAALAGELGPRDLAVLTRTLAWLGPVEGLARGSEEPVEGGLRRAYRVQFDDAELGLTVAIGSGKFEAFEFDEQQWSGFVERAAQADAGQLRVAEFRYLDAKGQAIDAPQDPAMIVYELALEGLEAQLREHHVTVAKVVFDAAGNQVYVQEKDDVVRFSQAESGASGGRLSGNVAVPGPGDYELELLIRDVVASTTLTHRERFKIP